MRTRFIVWVLLALTTVGMSRAQSAGNLALSGQGNSPMGRLPLFFEANKGQSASKVSFISRGPGYSAFLTSDGMVLSLRGQNGSVAHSNANNSLPNQTTLEFHLVGTSHLPAAIGEDQQNGRVNYFIGKDRSKWLTNVPVYSKVRYKSVYPGIDLIYYGNRQQLEYDFAVAPGSDPSKIRFEIRGAQQLRLDTQGNLVLQTPTGKVAFQPPMIYQEQAGARVPVKGAYVLEDATHIHFQLAAYDKTKTLTIDPVLIYSTYLGGSAGDQPGAVSVDSNGNIYITGSTSSTDFALTSFGSLVAGNIHVFVMKLDPTGSRLIFTDYIGGNSYDYGSAIALGAGDSVYVAGNATSSDFPMVNAFQPTYPGGYNAFLAGLSADGSSLLYSTYLGGNGSDNPVTLAIDPAGEMILAGYTSSTNFPVANAYQSTALPNAGGSYGDYGFVTKFTPDGSSLVFSTYLAGSNNVALNCGGTPCWPQPSSMIMGMQADAAGDAYVAGSTNTYDFPVSNPAYQTTNTTSMDNYAGFVTKFTTNGSVQYSTYFGSDLLTQISGIAVDGNGSAYVTGIAITDGTFPLTSASICDPAVSGSACNFGFVTKFDPTGTTLQYSTFLGPNNQASPVAIALDSSNDAFLLASVSANSYSAVNAMEGYSGGNDLLLVEIDPTATTQLFGTYLGGSTDEQPAAGGLTIDANGDLYAIGMTDSTDFPITSGAYQGTYGGNTDGFLMKIGAQSGAGISFSPNSLTYPSQAMGSTSAVQTVLLRNMGSAQLSISSITPQGDFSKIDNCGSYVPAAGSCTLSIAFSPTQGGTRNGAIAIDDDASGSPHLISLTGTGLGPAVVLTPQNLVFNSVLLGSSSTSQTVSISNSGNMTLNLAGIQTSGDFSQTNNCPSSLSAGQSCTVSVIFTPSASGQRSGLLSISDNGQGGGQTVNLSGTGTTLQLSVSPSTLTYPSQAIHSSSTPRSVLLTNSGSAQITLTGIQVSGDFAQTSNCPGTLAAGANCTVSLTFTPSASGQRTGTLTVNSDAANSPQVVSLSGAGSDFTLTTSAASQSVAPGSTATYTLDVADVGGAFSGTVKLGCGGNPANTTCSLSSSSVTPGSGKVAVTVSIGTVSTTARAAHRTQPLYAFWMGMQGLGVFGVFFVRPKHRSKSVIVVLSVLLFAALLLTTGCAGGTGIAQQPPSGSGTSAGTYTVTITGTSGSLQHTLPLTLTVQ